MLLPARLINIKMIYCKTNSDHNFELLSAALQIRQLRCV